MRATPTRERHPCRVAARGGAQGREDDGALRQRLPVREARRSSHDVLAFASQTLTVKQFAGRRFRPAQKIRIYVTRKGRIGKYIQYRVKRGNFKRTERCLKPGSMKPRKRCR